MDITDQDHKQELKTSYDAVIADMQAKADALNKALATLKFYRDMPPLSQWAVPVASFHGRSIQEAITLFLKTRNQPSTVREIADGLLAGGMKTASDNFPGIIRMELNHGSIKKRFVQCRIGIGRSSALWGLPEWGLAIKKHPRKRHAREIASETLPEPSGDAVN